MNKKLLIKKSPVLQENSTFLVILGNSKMKSWKCLERANAKTKSEKTLCAGTVTHTIELGANQCNYLHRSKMTSITTAMRFSTANVLQILACQ